jgi:hypothetical protein
MGLVSPSFITVVSGVPRSGTSMMMSMLEAGGIPPLTDELRSPDESNPRGYYELERVKALKQDSAWVADAVGKVVKVVHVHVRDLPPGYEYRVVLMVRDLREVVTSQKTMLERRGKAGGDLADERVMAIYAKQLADLRAWIDATPGFSRLDADYNRILADPRETVAGLDAFLGGGLNVQAMAQVVDPSLYRS